MTSSAVFRPGEKSKTNETGRVDSLVIAQASATNPTNKPSMAGKTQRNNVCLGIGDDSIKPRAAQCARSTRRAEARRYSRSRPSDGSVYG